MSARCTIVLVTAALLLAGVAAAGEPDWFTRVKDMGIEKACAVEVSRHEQGVMKDSLHVGRCYYNLGRYEEGLAVHRRLVRSPDLNYAAMAGVRVGEGLFHLGQGEKSRAAFVSCLEQHPEAWLDGSIADRCRAWISKLDGKLASPEQEAGSTSAIDEVKQEMKNLEQRLAELKKLLLRLVEED